MHENAAAAKRLAELDLTAADLISALIGADLEARTWTPPAPPMMAGLARAIRSGPNCRSPTALTDGATSASGLSGSSCLRSERTNAR
jgi:hypothetical protein